MTLLWTPGMTLEAVEESAIKQAMQFHRGNKTATSNALGIAVRTLDSKLEKYADEEKKNGSRFADRKEQQQRDLARARGIPFEQTSEEARSLNGEGAESGLRVQPASQPASQQSMPMPQRREVQTMLPANTPARGHNRRG